MPAILPGIEHGNVPDSVGRTASYDDVEPSVAIHIGNTEIGSRALRCWPITRRDGAEHAVHGRSGRDAGTLAILRGASARGAAVGRNDAAAEGVAHCDCNDPDCSGTSSWWHC